MLLGRKIVTALLSAGIALASPGPVPACAMLMLPGQECGTVPPSIPAETAGHCDAMEQPADASASDDPAVPAKDDACCAVIAPQSPAGGPAAKVDVSVPAETAEPLLDAPEPQSLEAAHEVPAALDTSPPDRLALLCILLI
jgi:hypothetical protein